MRLAEIKPSEAPEMSTLLGGNNSNLTCSSPLLTYLHITGNQMTILGELYQTEVTQNFYCRGKRPVTNTECYNGVCVGNSCGEGKNDMHFYSYSASVYGLSGPNTGLPPPKFMCEEP